MNKISSKKINTLIFIGVVVSVVVIVGALAVLASGYYPSHPSCKGKKDISIHRDLYLLCFSIENKQPSWVFQMVGIDSFKGGLSESPNEYYQDIAIPKSDQPSDKDYVGTQWVIGNYLFPFGEESIKQLGINSNEQYLFSVTSPQNRKLNQGYWKKLRGRVRGLIGKKEGSFYNTVGVFSGPLFLYDKSAKKEFLKPSKLLVPTHFFQIIIPHPSGEGMEIYVIPNQEIDQNIPLEKFQISMEKFAKISGIKGIKNVSGLIPFTPMPIP